MPKVMRVSASAGACATTSDSSDSSASLDLIVSVLLPTNSAPCGNERVSIRHTIPGVVPAQAGPHASLGSARFDVRVFYRLGWSRAPIGGRGGGNTVDIERKPDHR